MGKIGARTASARRPIAVVEPGLDVRGGTDIKQFLELSDREYVSPRQIALICAGLGEGERVFERLDRAYEARSALMNVGILNSPEYDPLRSDPQFEALVRMIGLKKQRGFTDESGWTN